jgi:hypothetical protein
MSNNESFGDIVFKMLRALPDGLNELNQSLVTGPHFAAMVGASAPSPAVPGALREGYGNVVGVGAGAVRSVALACANLIPAIAKNPDLKKTIDETSQWAVMTMFSGLQARNA